jgi:hypothetical protein
MWFDPGLCHTVSVEDAMRTECQMEREVTGADAIASAPLLGMLIALPISLVLWAPLLLFWML